MEKQITKVKDMTKPWIRQMYKVKDLPKGEEVIHLKPFVPERIPFPIVNNDD
jgi:hypothetical protein